MPAVAAQAVWLGAYLTNGKRLVQCISVDAEALYCENCSDPLDKPGKVLRIPFALIVRSHGGWRLVREGDINGGEA